METIENIICWSDSESSVCPSLHRIGSHEPDGTGKRTTKMPEARSETHSDVFEDDLSHFIGILKHLKESNVTVEDVFRVGKGTDSIEQNTNSPL